MLQSIDISIIFVAKTEILMNNSKRTNTRFNGHFSQFTWLGNGNPQETCEDRRILGAVSRVPSLAPN